MAKDDIKVITIGKKTVTLKIKDLDNDLDVDEMLQIDYANILGEILTFPVLLNRLGILLADVENALRRAEFDLAITKEDLKKKRAIVETKAFHALRDGDEKKNIKPINSPTKDQIGNYVRTKNPEHQKEEEKYIEEKRKLLDIIRDKDYINSFYWSAKSKDDKLSFNYCSFFLQVLLSDS